jgi:CBS domain-containing protein
VLEGDPGLAICPPAVPQLRSVAAESQTLRDSVRFRASPAGVKLVQVSVMKRYELRVSDLMSTAVITIGVGEPVSGAHAEMEVGVIHHLPVVDGKKRLIGVLSDRDVLRAGKSHHKVSDIMTRDPITVRPDAMAHTAASAMIENGVNSVLVTEDDGTLVGVVTSTDFIELGRRALLGLPLER